MLHALVIVDLQNDFMPGGALPVPEGDQIIPIIHDLQSQFELVVATQDWHPTDHGSFAVQHPGHQPGEVITLNGLPQVLWPVHCVQQTHGAEFIEGLDKTRINKIIQKGTDPSIDSYSGFFDNAHRRATGLETYLRAEGVDEITVVGVATDYCVKFTVLDACALGFKTTLIASACRGVGLHSQDIPKALAEMQAAGCQVK